VCYIIYCIIYIKVCGSNRHCYLHIGCGIINIRSYPQSLGLLMYAVQGNIYKHATHEMFAA
jgi:hypothetical protein